MNMMKFKNIYFWGWFCIFHEHYVTQKKVKNNIDVDAVGSSQLYMLSVLALLVPNTTTVPLLVAGYVIDNRHVFVDILVNPESQMR